MAQSKKAIRKQKLVALYSTLNGPKSANSKTVSYTRPQATAMLEHVKLMMEDENLYAIPANAKVRIS
jgi:hypothetical protein